MDTHMSSAASHCCTVPHMIEGVRKPPAPAQFCYPENGMMFLQVIHCHPLLECPEGQKHVESTRLHSPVASSTKCSASWQCRSCPQLCTVMQVTASAAHLGHYPQRSRKSVSISCFQKPSFTSVSGAITSRPVAFNALCYTPRLRAPHARAQAHVCSRTAASSARTIRMQFF